MNPLLRPIIYSRLFLESHTGTLRHCVLMFYILTRCGCGGGQTTSLNNIIFPQMGSAMDALKYSNYMSAAGPGLSSLYSGSGSDPSASLKSMYSGEGGSPGSTSGQTELGLQGSKTEYSADSLSRSYLEHQRAAYYETAGLKGYPGYGESGGKSYTPDSLSGRQSTESPEMKKSSSSSSSLTPDPSTAQAQALQAYYSQTMQAGPTSSSLPPLLPMAAQLSQYATSSTPGYSQASSASPANTADYSRRPLSVLF